MSESVKEVVSPQYFAVTRDLLLEVLSHLVDENSGTALYVKLSNLPKVNLVQETQTPATESGAV